MRSFLAGLTTVLVCGGLFAAEEPAYRAEELAAGVVLFRPLDERAGTNSLVVERRDGLLVIDAQPTPAAARALLAAVAERWDKPVRYLALSSSHAAAAGGVAAFPETTLVIASTRCREALDDAEFDFAAEMREMAGAAGWTDPARPEPTLLLAAPTTLDDPDHPVQFRPVRAAQSRGDMLVHIQRADVLYAGAIFFADRNPYAGGADVGHWRSLLGSIVREAPEVVVGRRGPAGGPAAAHAQRDALVWVLSAVEELIVDRVDPAEMESLVLARPELARRFDLEASPSFASTVVRQVIAESVGHRVKRGRM
jgi:glyoxylase-like metal-dependent hydrolase (beta-lactamase superfamily II)